MFCTRCGSTTHSAYDCSKPDQKLAVPTQQDYAEEYTKHEVSLARADSAATAGGVGSVDREPEPTFDPPRWPGGPHICNAANLPAFPTEAVLRSFIDSMPAVSASRVYQCDKCGEWHYDGHCRQPSERPNTLTLGFVPFRRKVRESAFAGSAHQGDLPEREVKPTPKKVIEHRSKPGLKGRCDGDLF